MRSDQSTVADTHFSPTVSEQTPLLGDEAQHAVVDPQEHGEDEAVLAQEPSSKELILILGCIWLGVFLAALGTGFRRVKLAQALKADCTRYNDCCYTHRSHLVVLPLLLLALLVSDLLPDFQCRFPAVER